MKLIPLHDRAGHTVGQAKVDDADFETLSSWSWSRAGAYAQAHEPGTGHNAPSVRMHRVILGLKPGDPHVDHRDHDGLNNQRENLRLATRSQNEQNRRGANRGSTSGHRGVTWNKQRRKWQAVGYYRNKNGQHRGKHLGLFDDVTEAARAATLWRRAHMSFSTNDQEG